MADLIWYLAAAIRARIRARRCSAAESIGLSRRAGGIRSRITSLRKSAVICDIAISVLTRSLPPSVHEKTEYEGRPNPTIAPRAAAKATTSNEESELDGFSVFAGVEDLLLVEGELVEGAEREVEEVGTTACSPKVYHDAVFPKPAVFVV